MAEETKTKTAKKGLYWKLLELQKSVRALGKNEKAYGYDYVSGGKLLFHLRPKMDELGLLLLPSTKSFSSQIVKTREEGTDKKGNPVVAKYENLVTITKTYTWVDAETGEKADFDFTAQGCNDWDKGCGSAETYAERYFLLKFFHIATDADDVDAIHNEPEQTLTRQSSTPSGPITKRLNDIRDGYYEELVQTAAENPDALWSLDNGEKLNSENLFLCYGPTDEEVAAFKQAVANHKELFVNNK